MHRLAISTLSIAGLAAGMISLSAPAVKAGKGKHIQGALLSLADDTTLITTARRLHLRWPDFARPWAGW